MVDRTTQVRLTINAGSDTDVSELEELTLRLKEELADLDEVESIEMARAGETPAGAKAGDAVLLGDLVMQLLAAGGVLTTMIGALQAWLKRHGRRSVSVEIGGDKLEVTGLSSQEQRRLVDAWIARHSSTEAQG